MILKKCSNIIVGFILLVVLLGCSKPEQVSSWEFINTYNKIEMQQTMHEISYLGKNEDKCYIRIRRMSLVNQKFSDHIIYAKIDELDSYFLQSLPQRMYIKYSFYNY